MTWSPPCWATRSQTVIKHYAHLIPEEQIALAAGDLGQILRAG